MDAGLSYLEQQRELCRRKLRALEDQAAMFASASIPAKLQAEIEDIQNEIERLETELARTTERSAALVPAAEGASSALNEEITAITDPLLQMGQDATIDDLVVASLQRVLTEAGPRQAEVLRRCAIPRWFDELVLAELRERRDGNAHILDLLRSYSFVRQFGEGRYGYHDQVRSALLQEWRTQRPDEFWAINTRLAAYFQQRADATRPPMTGPKSFPFMTTKVQAAPTGEWELCARESLYHLLMADPQAGLARLRPEFDKAESAHRLGDAEALVQLTRDAQLDSTQQLWVRYLQARIERAALRLDEAASLLKAIRADSPDDPLLLAKVNQTLGEVLSETGQWVQAIDLYQESLGYFEATRQRQDAALIMLRLGEAYQEIARNAGGWHVPAYPQSHFWRSLGETWYKLLSLPFYIVTWLLRRRWEDLPRPRYLGFYQNWLLIRVYRTARGWYERARRQFEELGDDLGMLNAEQRLAEILLIFGYPTEALARLNQAATRPSADDPYTRAWIDRDRASVLLLTGDIAGAQELLAPALVRFREIGDIRREAAVLGLQSHAAALAGDADTALEGYRSSLARFRALRYTAAREQVLYSLRAWQRMSGPGSLSNRISEVLAEEPEKRYVARFPRSQLLLLQVLSLAALPLTLLLQAIFAPTLRLRNVGSLVTQTLYYDPFSALLVLLVMVAFYSLAFTLVALAVIFLVPLDALRREQPDYLITAPHGIARFDNRGEQAIHLRWDALRRWMRADMRLWVRPWPLFSTTYLEDAAGHDLAVDGFTGWYSSVQQDIALHLRKAGNPIRSEDFGFSVLRSKSSISLAVGLLLLLFFTSSENGWLQWPIILLPPYLYAALLLFAFSGALILVPLAYWLVTRPLELRRRLDIQDRWPWVVGALGLATVLVCVLRGDSQAIWRVPGLSVGLIFWGAYIFGDALASTLAPYRQTARYLIIGLALCVAAVFAIPQGLTTYLATVSRVGAQRAQLLNNPQNGLALPIIVAGQADSANQALDASQIIVNQAEASPQQRAQAYVDQGRAYYAIGDYRQAADAYGQALTIYDQIDAASQSPAFIQTVATVHYNRGQALLQLGDRQGASQDILAACRLYPAIDPSVCARLP